MWNSKIYLENLLVKYWTELCYFKTFHINALEKRFTITLELYFNFDQNQHQDYYYLLLNEYHCCLILIQNLIYKIIAVYFLFHIFFKFNWLQWHLLSYSDIISSVIFGFWLSTFIDEFNLDPIDPSLLFVFSDYTLQVLFLIFLNPILIIGIGYIFEYKLLE